VATGDIKTQYGMLKECQDSTGKGMSELVVKILAELGISMINVFSGSTDGASDMTGDQNGAKAFLVRLNPFSVWSACVAHKAALCGKDLYVCK
jgi:hypothetical protein